MRKLILCSSCSRHIVANEAACPFCGASISDAARTSVSPEPPRGMSRAQMYAFKMALLASGAAALSCNEPTADETAGSATNTTATASASPTAAPSAEPSTAPSATAVVPGSSAAATASAGATASASATAVASVAAPPPPAPRPPPPPPVPVLTTRRHWPPPKPYGCVWPDPEEDDDAPVAV